MRGGRTAYGLAISLAALAAASLTAVGFSAVAPLVRGTFGLSEVEVGAIASCLAVGAVVAAVAPARWLFFAGVVGAGLGYGLVNPPTNVLANPGSPRLRGLAMSVKQSGIPLGGILAGVLVPRAAGAVGWRWATAVPIVGCVAVAAVAALGPRDRGIGAVADPADPPPGSPGPARPRRLAAPTYRLAPGLRLRLPLAYAFGFLMAGVQVAVFTLLTVYLVDDRGSAATAAGVALA